MTKEDYCILGIISYLYSVIHDHKETVKRYPDDVIEAVSVPYLVSALEKIKDEVQRSETE